MVFTMEIKKVHGKKTDKDFKRFEPIPEDRRKKKPGAAEVTASEVDEKTKSEL